jgi:hypothetical protein
MYKVDFIASKNPQFYRSLSRNVRRETFHWLEHLLYGEWRGRRAQVSGAANFAHEKHQPELRHHEFHPSHQQLLG